MNPQVALTVSVGRRTVGVGHPCFIIAEAGSNHNGSLVQAKRLIELAASAGADAVKFQVFRAEHLYPKNAGLCDYLKLPTSIYDIIAEMEIPYEWLPELAACCKERQILFMASVFDEESADRLDPYVLAHKIASYEMTHLPLIRHVAKKNKPLIISTGTADLDEVTKTVDAVYAMGNHQLMLMQCTAAYPAPLESLNIRAITTMQLTFNLPVGLSDHSRDPLVAPLAAVALGANLIEKHFTFSNELAGPDHRFAVEPQELRLMVRKIREVEQALGSGQKAMHPIEAELYQFARRYIFTIAPIKKGERLTPHNISVLRKGNHREGLPPDLWDEVIGKQAVCDIEAEQPLRIHDIA